MAATVATAGGRPADGDDLADGLARVALALRWDDLPSARRWRIALAAIDFLGLAVAGQRLPDARLAHAFTTPAGSDRLPGDPERRYDRGGALAALGTLGALLQLHDGFGGGGNHPSPALVPIAWAALADGTEPEEALTALAAGYEIANRLAEATHPDQSLRGSAPTATMGAIGAAAMAARLAGGDRGTMAAALRQAAFMAQPAPYRALRHHAPGVPVHGGLAARTGWEASRLASAGADGGTGILEAPDGLLATLAGRPVDGGAILTRLTEDPGGTLDRVYFKPLPGCRHVQPALEALLGLIADGALGDRGPERVTVATYPLALAFAAAPRPDHGLYDRLMSLRWALARCLLDRGYGPESPARTGDAAALAALYARIDAIEDPAATDHYPATLDATVTLSFAGGARAERTVRLAYGAAAGRDLLSPAGGHHPPLTADTLRHRFDDLTAEAWPDGAALADRLLDTVERSPRR